MERKTLRQEFRDTVVEGPVRPEDDPQIREAERAKAQAELDQIKDCSEESIRKAYINYMRLTGHNRDESYARVTDLFRITPEKLREILLK